jgi:hypothetical protein
LEYNIIKEKERKETLNLPLLLESVPGEKGLRKKSSLQKPFGYGIINIQGKGKESLPLRKEANYG